MKSNIKVAFFYHRGVEGGRDGPSAPVIHLKKPMNMNQTNGVLHQVFSIESNRSGTT
jgi:hypothetical protein